LTNADYMIRRDRLCPSAHWQFRDIPSTCAVHLYRRSI